MQMLVQRDPYAVRRRMRCRQRHPQDRIRTKLFFSRRPICSAQPPVDFLLIVDLDADHGSPKRIPDILHSPPDAATAIPAKITVPQLHCFRPARAGPGRDNRSPARSIRADNFHLYRRIRAAVEHFARKNIRNS